MYKETGLGQIDVFLEQPPAHVLEALLYNFDFDDFYGRKFRPLKQAHVKFLDEHVIPLLEKNAGNVWLQGSASRIGTDDWNMETSMTRAGQVQAYLMDHGVNGDQIEPHAVGSRNAVRLHHIMDDSRDRGVLLSVHPRLEDKKPPKQVPPRPKISRTFKIALEKEFPEHWKRQHSRLSWGARAAKWLLKKLPVGPNDRPFVIVDTTNNLACRYVYVDLSFGTTLGLGDSKLDGSHGPWQNFSTSKEIGCWQFGPEARITSLNDHDVSVDYIHIETPKGVSDVYLEMDTGHRTRGISGSIGLLGDFLLMEGPKPFSGP